MKKNNIHRTILLFCFFIIPLTAAALSVIGTISVGNIPNDIVISSAGIAYVSNESSNTFSVINTSSNTVTNTVTGRIRHVIRVSEVAYAFKPTPKAIRVLFKGNSVPMDMAFDDEGMASDYLELIVTEMQKE